MASNKDYLIYVLELLRELSGITYRRMMGEYILYKDNIVFGGIYDNRFLIKKTPYTDSLGFKEVIPYPTSKGLYLLDTEDTEEIALIVRKIIKELK